MDFTYGIENSLPFPQVSLKLSAAKSGKFFSGLPAKVDTGADRTVIPLQFLLPLSLPISDTLWFEGADGHRIQLRIYQVLVEIEGFAPVGVDAAASANENLILLGRDVLNLYCITLDGPNGRLHLSGT